MLAHADATGADVVYPWFDLNVGGRIDNSRDPLGAFGREFDASELPANNYIPVTALVPTSTFVAVGGLPQPMNAAGLPAACEDWGRWQRLLAPRHTFSHPPGRT